MMGERRPETSIVLSFLLISFGGTFAASQEFSALVSRYEAWRFQDNPSLATSMGQYQYNNKLERYTVAAYTEAQNTALRYLSDLEGMDEDSLSSSEKLSYKVLKSSLVYKTDGFHWFNYTFGNPVNFLEGVSTNDVQYSLISDGSEASFKDLVPRISSEYNRTLDEYITAMEGAVSSRFTNHRVAMVRTLENLDRILNETDPEKSDLYKAFLPYNGTDRQGFLNQVKSIITDSQLPKLRELKEFVENTYIKSTRPQIGVGSYSDGYNFYKACAKSHTSTDLTPEEIHNLGLSEVARIRKAMEQIMAKRNFVGSVQDFVTSLKSDSTLYANSSDSLVQYYRDVMADINKKVGDVFHTSDFPKSPVEVRPSKYDGPGGLYYGPSKLGEPGIFFLNAFHPDENALYLARALVMHEANPGHHFQIALQFEDVNLPVFRKFLFGKYYIVPSEYPMLTAYLEGWALYAEYLGEELGLYPTDLDLFGRYSSEIFRACRLVVDTGIHVFNWTKEDAVQFMLNNTAEGRTQMETEIDRYITWPGQALGYKIGELKIRALRKKAEDALGEKFSVKDFHGKVLRLGAAPLDVLEEVIDSWIEENKASHSGIITSSVSVLIVSLVLSCVYM